MQFRIPGTHRRLRLGPNFRLDAPAANRPGDFAVLKEEHLGAALLWRGAARVRDGRHDHTFAAVAGFVDHAIKIALGNCGHFRASLHRLQELLKYPVQLGGGSGFAQRVKRTRRRNALGRAHERTPGDASEGCADRDSSHAEIREFRHRQVWIRTRYQHVHRLRRNGFDDRFDLAWLGDAGRVETVGACFGLRDQSFERDGESVRIAHEPRLATSGQDHGNPRLIDRTARRFDPFDRKLYIVERRRIVPR